MGVVGGALFRPIMGRLADKDIATAYYLPILCYFIIFLFGYRFMKLKGKTGQLPDGLKMSKVSTDPESTYLKNI